MTLELTTAGESHGKGCLALVEGFPAGWRIDEEAIDRELARRQGGYGRGGRQKIEKDRIRILSGVRLGRTIGSPITLYVENRDQTIDRLPEVTCPRPGHADLAGAFKYGITDARDVLERSSARDTVSRVAAGSLVGQLLRSFGIEAFGFVREIGGIRCSESADPERLAELRVLRDRSPFYATRSDEEELIRRAIDEAREKGDSLGGIVEVVVTGLPPGLGSHVQYRDRLSGRLGAAVLSIQAFKGVEIGLGFEAARLPGSRVHDEIFFDSQARERTGGIRRGSNHAGGVEGGMTNGMPVVVRAAMKPIPTLMRPIRSIHLDTGQPADAAKERSDVCSVPAASVVAEAAVLFEIGRAFLEKFPGDTVEEVTWGWRAYLDRVSRLVGSTPVDVAEHRRRRGRGR